MLRREIVMFSGIDMYASRCKMKLESKAPEQSLRNREAENSSSEVEECLKILRLII